MLEQEQEEVKKGLINYFKKHPFIFVIIVIIIVILFYVVNEKYKLIEIFAQKREKITISVEGIGNDTTEIFILHNEDCNRNQNKMPKIEFICEKPDAGNYRYTIGSHDGKLNIKNNENAYDIIIDNNRYELKDVSLQLAKKEFNGKFTVWDINNGTPKYKNSQNNFQFWICGSNVKGNIKNGEIKFSKSWSEFSNIYYERKLALNYEIEGQKYFSSKPYFLQDPTFLKKVISIGQENLPESQKTKIEDYIQYSHGRLNIHNLQNKPNIVLVTINKTTKDSLNGYIKFKVHNINPSTKFNFWVGQKHIFRFEFPTFKYNIVENEIDSKNIDPITPNQNTIPKELIKNIKELRFQLEIKENQCEVKVSINHYKPSVKTFNCNFDDTNDTKNVDYHISVEDTKDTNKVLFGISDIETGINPDDSLIN